MRLNRIHTPGPLRSGATVALSTAGAHHIATVLRARVGDAIGVFDGDGNEFRAVIANIAGKSVAVVIGESVASIDDSPLAITLTQGISRGERMDWVVQKATELGAVAIAPVITTRSVVKLDRGQSEKRLNHWQSIVIGACEQCGKAKLPQLKLPTTLADHLRSSVADGLRVVLDPTATQSLMALPRMKCIELLIGPEGGLDDDEITAAKQAGFVGVNFGPRILRTETAAIAAIAALQGKWGDLQ